VKNGRRLLQFGSVASVDAEIGLLSPVSIERSNLRSLETSRRRRSAGTLDPRVILTMSPATSSDAGNLCRINNEWGGRGRIDTDAYLNVLPSRVTRTSVGSIPEMEAMTRPVE
jgi:hypothetical protein